MKKFTIVALAMGFGLMIGFGVGARVMSTTTESLITRQSNLIREQNRLVTEQQQTIELLLGKLKGYEPTAPESDRVTITL